MNAALPPAAEPIRRQQHSACEPQSQLRPAAVYRCWPGRPLLLATVHHLYRGFNACAPSLVCSQMGMNEPGPYLTKAALLVLSYGGLG